MASISSSSSSSPNVSTGSKGSSVSTTFREEYEEIMSHAVVTPKLNACKVLPAQQKKGEGERSGPGVHTVQVSHLELPQEEEREEEEREEDVITPSITPQRYTSISTPSFNHPPPPSHAHPQSEVARLEGQLDVWCNDLKRNVVAEFEQALLRGKEQQRTEMTQELHRLTAQKEQLQLQLDRNKALVTTFEQSVARKDEIIQSLTKSLQKQKERIGLARSFAVWRTKHNDGKREAFVSVIASKHYITNLQRSVFRAWFGLIQGRWKERVKKACQMRAQEVCLQLKEHHQNEMNKVQLLVQEKDEYISKLHHERDMFSENMKKAFMRGVCALNMETMNMFNSTAMSYHGDQPTPPTMEEYDHLEEEKESERNRRQPRVRIEKHLH